MIVIGGTAWYAWIEDFGAFDGLYMAVITLTTVGYEEVEPLDDSGRAFTIVYTIAGIGVMLYVAGSIVEELVAGSIADALGTRRWSRKAERMRDHVVVCGQGRVGGGDARTRRARARHRHAGGAPRGRARARRRTAARRRREVEVGAHRVAIKRRTPSARAR